MGQYPVAAKLVRHPRLQAQSRFDGAGGHGAFAHVDDVEDSPHVKETTATIPTPPHILQILVGL